jgi:hypothetical protein
MNFRGTIAMLTASFALIAAASGHTTPDSLTSLLRTMFVPSLLVAQPSGRKVLVGIWEVKQSPLLSLAKLGGDGSFTTVGGYQALQLIRTVQDVPHSEFLDPR